ncbi:hypothetical protein DERP_012425, partial [Dermatophagoides pteronyssinus]
WLFSSQNNLILESGCNGRESLKQTKCIGNDPSNLKFNINDCPDSTLIISSGPSIISGDFFLIKICSATCSSVSINSFNVSSKYNVYDVSSVKNSAGTKPNSFLMLHQNLVAGFVLVGIVNVYDSSDISSFVLDFFACFLIRISVDISSPPLSYSIVLVISNDANADCSSNSDSSSSSNSGFGFRNRNSTSSSTVSSSFGFCIRNVSDISSASFSSSSASDSDFTDDRSSSDSSGISTFGRNSSSSSDSSDSSFLGLRRSTISSITVTSSTTTISSTDISIFLVIFNSALASENEYFFGLPAETSSGCSSGFSFFNLITVSIDSSVDSSSFVSSSSGSSTTEGFSLITSSTVISSGCSSVGFGFNFIVCSSVGSSSIGFVICVSVLGSSLISSSSGSSTTEGFSLITSSTVISSGCSSAGFGFNFIVCSSAGSSSIGFVSSSVGVGFNRITCSTISGDSSFTTKGFNLITSSTVVSSNSSTGFGFNFITCSSTGCSSLGLGISSIRDSTNSGCFAVSIDVCITTGVAVDINSSGLISSSSLVRSFSLISSNFGFESFRFNFLITFCVSISTNDSSGSGRISISSGFVSSSTISSFGFNSISSSVTIGSSVFFTVSTSNLVSSSSGFFGLPSSGLSSSGISSSGLCSSPGISIISSVTSTCFSSLFPHPLLILQVQVEFLLLFSSLFPHPVLFLQVLVEFLLLAYLLQVVSSGNSSSGLCSSPVVTGFSSMISSFGFDSICSSVTSDFGSSGFSSLISGFDFRRIFFDGFFGLPSSSGFSSVISSSGFFSSSGISMISSGLCSSPVFFTVSTSTLDSSSSG